MNVTVYTQIAATASNIIFFLVFVVAYYKMNKMNRQALQLQEWQATAMGRPQALVDDGYSRLPEVDIVVRNISEGAAKEITFEFSDPIESTDGSVISNLAYFKDGLDFLAPGKEITSYWDHLSSLLPFMREKGLDRGIKVTTRYKDLAGESYATEWNLNPFVYRDNRYVHHKGIGDLVEAVKGLSEDGHQDSRASGRNARG